MATVLFTFFFLLHSLCFYLCGRQHLFRTIRIFFTLSREQEKEEERHILTCVCWSYIALALQMWQMISEVCSNISNEQFEHDQELLVWLALYCCRCCWSDRLHSSIDQQEWNYNQLRYTKAKPWEIEKVPVIQTHAQIVVWSVAIAGVLMSVYWWFLGSWKWTKSAQLCRPLRWHRHPNRPFCFALVSVKNSRLVNDTDTTYAYTQNISLRQKCKTISTKTTIITFQHSFRMYLLLFVIYNAEYGKWWWLAIWQGKQEQAEASDGKRKWGRAQMRQTSSLSLNYTFYCESKLHTKKEPPHCLASSTLFFSVTILSFLISVAY